MDPTSLGLMHVTIISISTCLGAFVFAYNTVCLTQIAQFLKQKNHLTTDQFVRQFSIATSCFNLGTFISPLLYKKYTQEFGERKGLLFIDIIGIIAILCELSQLNFWVLASSRLVLGFVIGISTAIIPVYINSLAPLQKVGKMGALNQVMQTLGVSAAYVAGYIFQNVDYLNDQIRWRLFLGFPLVFLLGRIFVMQFVYPFDCLQRHILRNQKNKLEEYCLLVYGNCEQETIKHLIQQKSFSKISTENTKTFKKRFIIALVVIASNQLSGTNSILYYAKQLFKKITDNDSKMSQDLITIMSFVQVASTLLSLKLVDRAGRKKMILIGQFTVIILLFLLSFTDRVLSNHINSQFFTIIMVSLIFSHLFTMNMTLGPCCIIYCTQIVSDITWIIVTLKGCALLIALSTDFMIEYIGLGYMFLMYGGMSLLAHGFLRGKIMETKGKAVQEIYRQFGSWRKSQNEESGSSSTIITEQVIQSEALVK